MRVGTTLPPLRGGCGASGALDALPVSLRAIRSTSPQLLVFEPTTEGDAPHLLGTRPPGPVSLRLSGCMHGLRPPAGRPLHPFASRATIMFAVTVAGRPIVAQVPAAGASRQFNLSHLA